MYSYIYLDHFAIPWKLTQPCKSTILQFLRNVAILWGHFHTSCDDLLEARRLIPPLPNALWDLTSPSPDQALGPQLYPPPPAGTLGPLSPVAMSGSSSAPQIPAWQPLPPLSLATNLPFLCGPSLVILLTLKEGPNPTLTHPSPTQLSQKLPPPSTHRMQMVTACLVILSPTGKHQDGIRSAHDQRKRWHSGAGTHASLQVNRAEEHCCGAARP